jgi:hypothetical protein
MIMPNSHTRYARMSDFMSPIPTESWQSKNAVEVCVEICGTHLTGLPDEYQTFSTGFHVRS